MSILIKGMEMPRKGEYLMTLYVDSDGSAYIDVESFPEDKDKFEAIEVPTPHGRLVDGDALKQKKKHSNEFAENVVSVAEIDWMPTIIESEEMNG